MLRGRFPTRPFETERMNAKRFLVVGGDSLVGSRLVETFKERGHDAQGTTRRQPAKGPAQRYLDIAHIPDSFTPSDVDHVYLVAAISNYGQCETDPLAWPLNVEAIPRLARHYLQRGIRVSFISTNTVFGPASHWPTETSPHHPTIAYAQQKSAGESAIKSAAAELNATENLNIIRLTKIIGPQTPPLPDWLDALERDQPIMPFTDLIFAPMSLDYVADALARLGETWRSGELHLSGAESVDYANFAARLAEAMGKPGNLVVPTTSAERGINLVYQPTCGGISMNRTCALTGLKPESLDAVISYILSQRRDSAAKT